jgi:GntR family transcriptional regulator
MGLTEILDPEAVDRDAPLPLYHQLRQALLAPMQEGHWREGDLIPTEREICDMYKVSRITVRRAIEMLVREGYLVAHQGKGTFVARQKIQRHLTRLKSYSEEMQAEGHRPGSHLLSLRHERAVGDVAEALRLDDQQWVWVVERLRLADDEPTAISHAYLHLPPEVYLTPAEIQQNVSLWGVLYAKGVTFAYSEDTIQAVPATEREASLLEVPPGSPLLMVEGVVYTDQGSPVEYHKMLNRGDRYKYSVRTAR